MRKPRDYDAELKALDERARELRTRRLAQFGELVIATGADALDVEMLTGALLAAVESKDNATKEAWRRRGTAFFQRSPRGAAGGAGDRARDGAAAQGGTLPAGAETGKA
ncbi:MAG: conjugal transfer protein TraD [Sphingosinicella sp.]|uniref:conjugal transfer protein TraD n=1 Tax=Sphingosinicella sp. TaxID=1917971 RepID=UPI0040376068